MRQSIKGALCFSRHVPRHLRIPSHGDGQNPDHVRLSGILYIQFVRYRNTVVTVPSSLLWARLSPFAQPVLTHPLSYASRQFLC